MTNKSNSALAAVALSLLLCSIPVVAATVTFANNRAGFLAATGATSIGALPGSPTPANVDGVTVGPVTFQEVAGSNAVFFNFSSEISGNDIGVSGPENFNLLVAAGVYSIGFDIDQPTFQGLNDYDHPGGWGCNATCFATTFGIELFSGGASLGLFTYQPPDDTDARANIGALGFFGVHSSVAFDKVQVRDVTNTIDNEFFGAFLAGRGALAVTSVPEPSTYPLAALALGILWLTIRRRNT